MTRPTLEQARDAIKTASGTNWPSEAVRDTAFLILVLDGFDRAAASKAVDRAFADMQREDAN
ncbi:hypothetical protein [Thioclava sp. DLFJ4-1]|uniref:hypothetical protein n=1 Tax=Thioclava sp. DLFJ4-1 TaxID=1915313 RepID=UPI0009973217|nr:hypothetical protein [Thioclava sp. DLFJ4-1]OOY15102.1 hypothetical protein BMI85_16275 [Thioclava sp. DLFJ4-1]